MDRSYQNYIFDLYGTLIDIQTDEKDPAVWKSMQGLYARYGADYELPGQLRERYEELCAAFLAESSGRTGSRHPEIEIGRVFQSLYETTPRCHAARHVFDQAAAGFLAETFRAMTIRRLGLFPGTLPALQHLKENGAKLYLLSNAQRLFTWSELEMSGLLPYFEAVYISSDYSIKKPDPAFMERLLEEQHLDRKESVMVGNEIGSDMAAAFACGLDGVYLNTDKRSVPQVRRDLAALTASSPEESASSSRGKTESSVQIIWSGDLREIAEVKAEI